MKDIFKTKIINLLKLNGAVKECAVILSNGEKSNYYIDLTPPPIINGGIPGLIRAVPDIGLLQQPGYLLHRLKLAPVY
jgi:hypothetical protein